MTLWTPTNLATAPRIWADGDQAVFSGSNLTSLANAGSDGGSFTKNGSPTKATLNALNGIIFDANGESLSKSVAWGSSGVLFLFFLAKPFGYGGSYGGLMHIGSVASSGTTSVHYPEDDSLAIFVTGNGFGGGNAPKLNSGSISVSGWPTPYIGTIQLATTNKARVNGADQMGTISSSPGAFPNITDTLTIGETWDPQNFNGEIYQCLLLDYAPSVGDIEKLEGWAAWKYGIQAVLPGGHSYAGAAPTVAAGYSLSCAAGSFALSGQVAAPQTARKVAAAQPAFALSGQVATLSYTSAAAQVIAAMTTPPSSGHQTAITNFVSGMQTAGLWAKAVYMHVHRAQDTQAACLDWRNPSTGPVASLVNSPSFVAFQGFTTNGTNSEVDTNFDPSTMGGVSSQNSACFVVSSESATAVDNPNAGWFDGTDGVTITFRRNSDGNTRGRMFQTAAITVAVASAAGLYAMNRSASGAVQLYRNGSSVVTGANGSVTRNNNTLRLGRTETANYGAGVFGMSAFFSSLNSTEISDLNTLWQAFKTATAAISYSLTCASGSLALAGQASALRAARKITAAQGAYNLGGQAATLTYLRRIRMTADVGACALTGPAVTLRSSSLWQRVDPVAETWSAAAATPETWTAVPSNPETWSAA